MKVIILAGGQGTRLREETEYRPKPLVDIGGRPILWHIMKHYAYYDFKEFVICLGYRGHMIKDYFLNYEAMNNDFTICLGARNNTTYHGNHQEKDYLVTLAETGLETMTGARVKLAEKYIDEEIFMVTYGDGVCDVDLQALLKFHTCPWTTGNCNYCPSRLPLRNFGYKIRWLCGGIFRKTPNGRLGQCWLFCFQQKSV
jgi:glucose-1-phosphate cytidylyltransferase